MAIPVGIDLGTTNSVACIQRGNRTEVIPVEGDPLLPSVLAIPASGEPLVGQRARNHAVIAPQEVISSAKRFIGDGHTLWNIQGKDYSPVDVAAHVLARLKQATEAYLGEGVKQAVITVPAYFNNNQRLATRQAGEQAGWEVLELLPEPEAAAISYALDRGKNQTIVVYDLGGGTFDVSVLEVKGNRFVVKAVGGDAHLGGDDFDRLLGGYLIDRMMEESRADLSALRQLVVEGRALDGSLPLALRQAVRKVLTAAEAAKCEVSKETSVDVLLTDVMGQSLDFTLHRDVYDRLIAPYVEQTIVALQETLRAASLSVGDVARVVLVGGSTRNRLIGRRLKEVVKEPWAHDQVDMAVAQGAAIIARHLASGIMGKELVRQSVTPFSLGVCASKPDKPSSYFNSILIKQNSPIPSSETRPYRIRTQRDRANQLDVFVLQGESEDPADSLVREKYVFTDLTHVGGHPAIVDIEYGYNQDGIITVAARERASGKSLPSRKEILPSDMSWLSGNVSMLPDKFPIDDKSKAYTEYAGKQYIPEAMSDKYGNAEGSQYDLADDGTFKGYTIAVLHLYTGEGFDFAAPTRALQEKGFEILRWTKPPSIAEFRKGLDSACQLWIVSSRDQLLTDAHIHEIADFFNSGRGLYIWGDNDPFYVDANRVTKRLFNTALSGNSMGDKLLTLQQRAGGAGFGSHLITTGIQNLYEGITISTITDVSKVSPIVCGSDGKPLIGLYDADGRRALIDGGFTRLFLKWDSAGTGRYVKNAAAWLFNYERFGL